MESNQNTNRSTNNNDIIDIREIASKYLKKWYIFVISLFIVFSLTALYYLRTVPSYSVQTSILLRQDNNAGALSEQAILENFGMTGSNKDAEDEMQILSSKTIMQNAVKKLGIETEYYKKTGLKKLDIYPATPLKIILPENFNDTLKSTLKLKIEASGDGYKIKYECWKQKETYKIKNLSSGISTPVGKISFIVNPDFDKTEKYEIVSYSYRVISDIYSQQITIAQANKKSNAINISNIAKNKTKAINLLNKLVDLYNLDAVIDKNMIAANTKDFVDDRIKLIQTELSDVEEHVENYKKENNLTDISSEAELFLQTSSEYNKKLSEIETQLNIVSYIEDYIKENKNQYSLIPANLGIEDQSLADQVKIYNETLLERLKLLRTTNTENPVTSQLEQQIRALRSTVIMSIGSIKEGLKISKNDLLKKESQFTNKIKEIPTQERKYIEIKRQQEIKQNLYLFLLQKREENALTLASTVPSAKTLDKAYASIQPVSPKLTLLFAIALILGFGFPIGIIYVLDLFDNKISDRKQFRKLVKVPFLGVIGNSKENDRVVVREGKTTSIVEMFRMVRTNLQFMLNGESSHVLLITSSISGEGKSFTAINLATSFALLNKKVILVGLDIRKPKLGDYMHISKSSGITLYLSSDSYQTKDIIIPSGIHKMFDVIPAGPIPPNPSELLMSKKLDNLIEELKKDYEYIIIDSAPVGVVSDTFLLNRFTDLSIYVSRQNYTPRELTELINEIYNNNRLKNMGVILNGVDENSGYGYGYGYESKK
ncbi:MAG: polysaccharide biosynthesis tyrosine autokinase [Paludibacter sp.]|nr:polysaccharide biosynthesis tyrosine autokinase [Paludibacter sp.]